MATLGTAIVGAPLTMAFLVLESSGDVAVAGPVLAGCIASHLTTRAIFGYSFSTWRLHLRGEDITGAHDVGWVRTILVAGLMDTKPRTMPAEATLAAFRLAHPLGGRQLCGAGRRGGALPRPGLDGRGPCGGGGRRTVATLARLADVHAEARAEYSRGARTLSRNPARTFSPSRTTRALSWEPWARLTPRGDTPRRSIGPRKACSAAAEPKSALICDAWRHAWLAPCFSARKGACVAFAFGFFCWR